MGKQELTVNKLVTCLIALAMGLVTVCGLATVVMRLYPVEVPSRVYTDRGYTYFRFTSNVFSSAYGAHITLGGALNILQMLVGLVTLFFSVFGLLAFNAKKAKKLNMLFMIFCLVMLLWYLFEGIYFSGLNDYPRYFTDIYGLAEVNVTTQTYIPLIFGVLLFAAYFVCAKKLPQKTLRRAPAAQAAPAEVSPMQQPVQESRPAPQGQKTASQPEPQEPFAAGQPTLQPHHDGRPAAQQEPFAAGHSAQPPYNGGQPMPQQESFAAGHSAPPPYNGGQPMPQHQAVNSSVQQQQAVNRPVQQPFSAARMQEKVKLLTQYKQLLDSGILTQEEFDKLKAETLGKQ